MPASKRPKREPTDDWDQLQLWVTSPEQETYELLRPIVLFGRTPAMRAAETGTSERTLRRHAEHFEQRGMASLFDVSTPPDPDRRKLPEEIREAILTLQAEYPAFTPNEIASICRFRFERPVHRQTVQRLLATTPLPTLVGRRYPPYHAFRDPADRRLAIVRLYRDEGWSVTSIAGYLGTTRPRIYETLRRWYEECVPGLDDHSRAPKQPARKVDLRALAAIRRLQANPELGEFRIHAALEERGIYLSPRTCGRILAPHRELYGLAGPAPGAPHETLSMPFAATRRHQWWSVDVRYIEDHGLSTEKPVYIIGVLDNYSRALVASLITPRQDLTAYLIVLRDAMLRHGVPEGIVSDGGSIFRVFDTPFGIEKRQIDSAQAWQNYIETAFNVQRRLADYHFAQATSWAELDAVHARYFHEYNHQSHFAHRHRPAGRRSPARVLGFVQGSWCNPADLDRLFRLRAERRIDADGYVRFRHWRLYGAASRPATSHPSRSWHHSMSSPGRRLTGCRRMHHASHVEQVTNCGSCRLRTSRKPRCPKRAAATATAAHRPGRRPPISSLYVSEVGSSDILVIRGKPTHWTAQWRLDRRRLSAASVSTSRWMGRNHYHHQKLG